MLVRDVAPLLPRQEAAPILRRAAVHGLGAEMHAQMAITKGEPIFARVFIPIALLAGHGVGHCPFAFGHVNPVPPRFDDGRDGDNERVAETSNTQRTGRV